MSERGSVRRRRLAGRTATLLGVLCAASAIGVLSYAAYELWGTGGEEAAVQEGLRAAFESHDEDVTTTAPQTPSSDVEADDERSEPGKATVVFVDEVEEATERKGALRRLIGSLRRPN